MGNVTGTIVTATVSGTVSEATGGKFANGAMTGAFVHMFNVEATSYMRNNTVQPYSGKDGFIKATVQLNQNKVDSFFGKALLFLAGGGAAGSAAKFGYGYAARNPEVGFKVVDFISSYFPGTPASSYSGAAGFAGSYVYGHEKW